MRPVHKPLLIEVYFSFGSSSIRTAYPAAEKLASVISASCFSGKGCYEANWQLLSKSLLILVNCCANSRVTNTLVSFFNNLKNGVKFSECLGM